MYVAATLSLRKAKPNPACSSPQLVSQTLSSSDSASEDYYNSEVQFAVARSSLQQEHSIVSYSLCFRSL
jgi:hypothetical protein